MPEGDLLRKRKQRDFDLFGRSLGISTYVQVTPELIEAARRFRSYSVLADDVVRSVDVANAIVRASAKPHTHEGYQLLSAEWLTETFEACSERLAQWLDAWQTLEAAEGHPVSARAIRAELGLTPATPDELA